MSPRLTLVCLVLSAAACGDVDPAAPDSGTTPTPDAGAPAADAAPPDYERLFPPDRILEVDLAIAPADWAAMLADPQAEAYYPATLTYDGEVLPQVAVRFKGNSSLNSVAMMGSERFSFKVDTDEYVAGQKLFGIDKLNLNNGFKDPSYLRERLATDLLRAHGVPASRTTYARLTLSGELHGLYLVVEQVDKDFLREHFPDDSGNLYKPEMPDGELRWRGNDIALYPKMELKTNEDAPDHTALLHFLDVLNNGGAALADVFEIESFLRFLAVNTALVNLDSYAGMGHNFYLYQDLTTGRFVHVPWDTNEAFGNFTCNKLPDDLLGLAHEAPICGDPTRRPLIMKILAVPEHLALYQQYLAEVIATLPADVAAAVDAVAPMIRPDVAADPTRFFSLADFDANLHDDLVRGPNTIFGLTSFADRRAALVGAQLP
jgi:hypothetical protein